MRFVSDHLTGIQCGIPLIPAPNNIRRREYRAMPAPLLPYTGWLLGQTVATVIRWSAFT